MRSQILMLRALGEAYSKRADAAPSTAATLRHHAIAHFEAADALEAQHREVMARCVTTPADVESAVALTETSDEKGADA